jgi:hypothetical protein
VIESIVSAMERDAWLRSRADVLKASEHRWLTAARLVVLLLTLPLGGVLIATGAALADHLRRQGVLLAAVLATSCLLLVAEIVRSDRRAVLYFARRLQLAQGSLHTRLAEDPLALPLWLSGAVLWLPLILGMAWWIGAYSTFDASQLQDLRHQAEQLLPIVAGLLAIQITLFVFVFTNLLGRYSGQVSQALVTHRAIVSIVIFAIVSEALLWIESFSDIRRHTWAQLPPTLLAILTAVQFLLSLLVTKSAMANENAVAYAATHFARRVRHVLKPAIRYNLCWRVLAWCGLDLRDGERAFPLLPPQQAVSRVQMLFMAMMNTAHRSLRDGEQEVFNASLIGIARIARSYIDRRGSYRFSDDKVFSFLNDQIAALIHVSARDDNESLLPMVIRASGFLGSLSFSIPVLRAAGSPAPQLNHPAAAPWFALLQEGFEASHTLKRSTASSEALAQLGSCAIAGIRKEFPEVIAFNFIPALAQIHSVCLAHQSDSYHRYLATYSIQQVLRVWWASSQIPRRLVGISDPHQQIVKFIRGVAPSSFATFKHVNVGGSDFISELSIKDAADKATVQDIAIVILLRTNNEPGQLDYSVRDLVTMLELLGQLIIESTKAGVWNCEYLCAALYEIGYLLLYKLPAAYGGGEAKEGDPSRMRLRKAPDRTLIEALYSVWTNVIKASPFSMCQGNEWHQSMIALLGLGMFKYQDRPTPWFKTQLEEAALAYKEAAKTISGQCHSIEDPWAYLQLVGAWCAHFLANDVLGSAIIQLLSERGRLGRRGDGGRGRHTWLGYPSVSFGNDFFLPWLRNLQPTGYLIPEDWKGFQAIQEQLMESSVLMAFSDRMRPSAGAE